MGALKGMLGDDANLAWFLHGATWNAQCRADSNVECEVRAEFKWKAGKFQNKVSSIWNLIGLAMSCLLFVKGLITS